MAMNYEELDQTTREYMRSEFEADESGGHPYHSKALSAEGVAAFPDLMMAAIDAGNELTLTQGLGDSRFWNPTERYVRSGVERERQRNIGQAAARLGLTEFNTWYVKGLVRRLLDEGVETCQVCRRPTQVGTW